MASKGGSSAILKQLKLAGITVAGLLEDSLRPGNYGLLKLDQFRMFWTLIATSDLREPTLYLDEILKKTVAYLEANKGGPPAESDPSSPVSLGLEPLLNTINFIVLNLDFGVSDTRIRRFLDQWNKNEQLKESANRNYPQLKEVIRLLQLRCDSVDMIGPLIIGCSTMHGVQEFQRLTDLINYPTLDDAETLQKSCEGCFIYDHLRKLCLDREKFNSILHNTFNKMLTLPQQMKVNPKVAETTFCALVHMLQQFLSIAPVPDPNSLKSILSTIQQFYLWPSPYGSLTRDLLYKLQVEAQIPGTFMRNRLIEECASAEFRISETPMGAEEDNLGAGLFYFSDSEDKASQAFLATSDVAPLKFPVQWKRRVSEEPGLLTFAHKALIVLNMLQGDIGVTEADVHCLRQLTNEQIDQLYRRTGQMIKEITEKPEEAHPIRVNTLAQIRDWLPQMAHQNAQSGRRDFIRLPEVLYPPFLPPLPTAVHLAVQTQVSFQFLSKEQMTFLCLTETPYPQTPLYEPFIQLLQFYTSNAAAGGVKSSPVQLRALITGGDETLLAFLCAYLNAKQNKPELFDGIQMKFYLIPVSSSANNAGSSRNHVANFIARHDSWYQRHVLLPLRSPAFILPGVSISENSRVEEAKAGQEGRETTKVGQFFRSSMEYYVREAALSIDFHLYRVEGWYYPAAQKAVQPDQVIPAIQRVELGATAVAAQMKLKEEKKYGSLSAEAIAKDKNFDFSPPEVSVKFTKMDLSGRVQETIQDDPAVYHSVVLASVPRKQDICFPPSPLAPNLEMAARMHKSYQRQANRKNLLASDPKQHVIECEISAAQPNQQFQILVDGQLFGPFHHVRIAPIMDRNGQRMKFPIQTFFPLDV